jgi:uncharacterized membrane protein
VPKKPLFHQVIYAFEPIHFAKDLFVIILWMLAAVLCIYVPFLNQSILRALFALPVILFIPGYTLIAALFPGKEDLKGLERLALSFGLSIAVVPLMGFFLNYTPWGIRLDPIIISLVIFTAVMVLIAQYRRSLLDQDKRFVVPFHRMLSGVRDELFEPGQSSRDRTLSIILIIAIITVVATTIFVIVVPKESENFTEFYILGPDGKATDYPLRFPVGEKQFLIIGIGNNEYRKVTYTVEAILLNQSFDPDTNTTVISFYQPLDSFIAIIGHNETREFSYNFTVNDIKYNQLQFLLFSETVPSTTITGSDRVNSSYRDLHLWITVNPRVAS